MNSNKQIVQFKLDDDKVVYVEVERQSGGGEQLVSNKSDEAARVEKTFTDALSYLGPAARAVLNTFRNANQPDEIAPDEINLEFGVKFDGKVGAIIASASTEANIKVSLKWKNNTNIP